MEIREAAYIGPAPERETPYTEPQASCRAPQPLVTIFVPTYNRAHILPRLLRSIAAQTCTAFELLIVDDGSTDNTRQLIEAFSRTVPFPVRYLYQPNQGRHIAFNTAFREAQGTLFTTINSDDTLTPEAIERFLYWWYEAQKMDDRVQGVEALCGCLHTGQLIGTSFPRSPMIADHVEVYYRLGCWGDAIRMVRTDVITRYQFPQIEGERYFPPSFLWNRLGFDRHRMLYINEILAYKDYRPDGVTRNRAKIRLRNAKGYELYYRNFLESAHKDGRIPLKVMLRHYSNWVRSSLFLYPSVGKALRYTWQNIPHRFYWLPSIIVGLGLWLHDTFKTRKK